MASNLDRLSKSLQNTPAASNDPVADRLDKANNRLDEMADMQEDIKRLLGKNGGGKGKEDQLKRVKGATDKSSITRVSGENAVAILKTATENLADHLEKFSKDEHAMFTDIIKKIGELTEKNIEEYNKKSKELIDELKKGQELAEKSGNKELQKRLQNTEGQTREQMYKANKMDLRGSKDTFTNRFARTFGVKNEKGTHEFSDAKMGFTDKAKAFGTALKVGAKEFGGGVATGLKHGAKGSLRESITMSDTKKTRQFEKDNNLSKHIMRLDELDEKDIAGLASRGIAPKSEKDIAYRKDNKPVSKADINADLSAAYDEKNPVAAAEIAAPVTDTGSDMQEVSAGLADSPVVDAIEAQTEVIKGISDTSKQTLELIDAINKSMQKIADSMDNTTEGPGGGDNGGGPVIDIDLPSRRNRGGSIPDGPDGRKQSRSERARSQPRDAKGRFVRKTPDVSPGRRPGRGRGLLGVLAVGAGAVGVGSMVAGNDNDGGATEVAANTAMTAADLVPDTGSTTTKAEAKAGEKTAAKGAEKATVKAGEKTAAKGAEKATVKAGEKVAVKSAGKVGTKTAAKVGAKALGKSLLKKIPGVGLLAGGVFAAQRAMSGDWKGAGLELASGAASTIPGVGTAASVGIDAALAARDMGAFDSANPTTNAGGTPKSSGGTSDAPKGPSNKSTPVAGKPGGGIFSKVGGVIKKNPLMAAAGLGGVGLAAVGAKKAWDWMSGSGEEAKVQSGQNPDSGILEKGSDAARDKMNVNVPPPTVIQAPGQPAASTSDSSNPKMRGYVRDDESSWMRFALKRAMA